MMSMDGALDERKRLFFETWRKKCFWGLMVLLLMLGVSGCMYHGNSETADYQHGGTSSYGHVGVEIMVILNFPVR